VETSVNGLADGAGLAAFEEVVMALKVMYRLNIRIKTHKIMELSEMIQEISGVKVQPHKPLVGKSVFVETPDTHIEAILRARLDTKDSRKRPKSFIAPELIGQKRSLLFGPSALGGKSIELKGKEMGIQLDTKQVQEILGVMRNKLRHVDSLSEDEVERIISGDAK
jgi:isopropylmalate/homocitrate/citramalate synthase